MKAIAVFLPVVVSLGSIACSSTPPRLVAGRTLVTTPNVGPDRAGVRVTAEASNPSDRSRTVSLVVYVAGPDGDAAGPAESSPVTVPPRSTAMLGVGLVLDRPHLWTIGRGTTYGALVALREKGVSTDAGEAAFVVRDVRTDPAGRLTLDGRAVPLRRVRLRPDAASTQQPALARRLLRLREIGVNAVYPADAAVVALCDRLGLLAVDPPVPTADTEPTDSDLLDAADAFTPLAYRRQIEWADRPTVRVARRAAPPAALRADWSPADLGRHDETVEVYGNCQEAELFLNGRSLGRRPRPADGSPWVWAVPFEAGSLRALGFDPGGITATDELVTAAPSTDTTTTRP